MLISKDPTLIYLYQRFGTARLREVTREESTALAEAGALNIVVVPIDDRDATFYQSDASGVLIRDYQESNGELPPGFQEIGY